MPAWQPMHNCRQFLIAVDQLFNVLVSIFLREKAWADESLSAHAWRWELNGVRSWPRRWIDRLFFWQGAHCKSSYESEKTGRQLPPELRP